MSHGSSDGAEPNLTPILDMVFQLITFFMLVINFKGASMDLSLKLPVLGSARPLDYHGSNEPIMLNLTREGKVIAYGREIEPEKYLSREAQFLKSKLAGDQEIELPIIIRADRTVEFSTLNRLIQTCQGQGFRRFSLGAVSKEEGS
jgi:biopolymer transport protein ExbD